MKALVVDDSKPIRSVIKRMLASVNWEVSEASSGLEALAKLEQEGPFGLMLLDWNMPEMDGYQLLCELRKRPSPLELPILMVTSESEIGRVNSALEAGASEYLMKPFTKEALFAKLELMRLEGLDETGARTDR